MKLTLERRWPRETYTIGRLYVDGLFECNTLEDKDRGLEQSTPLDVIKKKKVYGETAIPKGTYVVSMTTTSPKYAAISFYWQLCRGKMPRLLDVPDFEGILVHPGKDPTQTLGCVLVGKNTKVGQLTESKAAFQKLYKKMLAAHKRGEQITIEIV